MPDDRRKFSRTATGTVPKIKCRNNTTQSNPPEFLRNLSNNLDLGCQRQDLYYRNPAGRNFFALNQYQMETTEDCRQSEPLNVQDTNGTLSAPSTSGSTSRRDSVGTIPKCDNVKKCPDKQQIEEKLHQIREYLQVTTSLMSSIKNNEDQSAVSEREQFEAMIKDLKDSEKKLLVLLHDPLFDDSDEVAQSNEENHNVDMAVSEHMQKFSQLLDILACQQDKINNIYNTNNGSPDNGIENTSEASAYQRNELEEKVEFTNRKVQLLREQQNALINLKTKAENQLKDAKLAQENLLRLQQSQKSGNEMSNGTNGELILCETQQQTDKNSTEGHIDITLKALSDKLLHLRQCASVRPQNIQMSDECLQEPFENSHQLLHILDNRDSELNSEHLELQQKFNDLQSKKLQIDQLAQQLQDLGEEDEEDIGSQVRKIVTMKQQLSSLKDLLDVVKNTEYSLAEAQNVNDVQENSTEMRTKRDNIKQEDRSKRNQNERRRPENVSTRSNSNEQWVLDKSNKSLLKVQEQEKVLAELKAKKRELEEIMYKQKDRSSINNDVFSETSANKSELSTNNMFDNVTSWLPVQPMQQHNHVTSVYSSDDCPEEDINEYSELNSTADLGNIPQPQPLFNSNYSTSSFSKRGEEFPRRFDNFAGSFTQQSSTQTSERFYPNEMPVFPNRRSSSNPATESQSNCSQVQKQLELIQAVCQSLLDHQSSNNVQQLRNNLTPSPVYAELRSFPTANPRQNIPPPANLSNLTTEPSNYINPQLLNPQFFAMNEVANNQNMLTANTLQTQAFLLNTLNQCCQMLWFQQKEIASLRNMIGSMQNRMELQPEQDLNADPSSSYLFPNRPISSLSSFRSSQRNTTNNKTNQVSSACSLPNLNPLGVHANMENAYANHNNVIRSSPSARLLEATLNNTAHHNLVNEPINNTVLPSVNTNVNMGQPLPQQIWNGTALNNQVAPGNRANNYWDNFRSYSRQNLLSTSSKSNEVLQNLPSLPTGLEHSNDRPLFSLTPSVGVPKLNLGSTKQSSSVTEGNTTSSRQIFFKGSQNSENSKKPMAAIPPDVLNINHVGNNEKINERYELINHPPSSFNDSILEPTEIISTTHSDGQNEIHRNHNEWTDTEQAAESSPKSKLFEELRDNVYKEVANLISANVNRPHFLIQLFRDLQQINSDPLRGRTLQSIQSVITNSFSSLERTGGASRQVSSGHMNSEHADPDFLVLPTPIWPTQSSIAKMAQNSTSNFEIPNDSGDTATLPPPVIMEYISSQSNAIFDENLIEVLKQLMVEQITRANGFVESGASIQKRYSAIFVKAFDKYKGKRILDIHDELLVVTSNILMVDYSILCLLEDYSIKVYENMSGALANTQHHSNGLSLNLTSQINNFIEEPSTPQMQNGDLAEADQSHLVVQEEEEEGAVGGVMNIFLEPNYNGAEFVDANISDLPKIDAPMNAECDGEFSEQSLDQVPTRLTTNSRSNSNTPSRGCKSDSLEHF